MSSDAENRGSVVAARSPAMLIRPSRKRILCIHPDIIFGSNSPIIRGRSQGMPVLSLPYCSTIDSCSDAVMRAGNHSLTVVARDLPQYVRPIRVLASRARQQAMPHRMWGRRSRIFLSRSLLVQMLTDWRRFALPPDSEYSAYRAG